VSDPSSLGESTKMSDLLSAASLLLTLIGFVYGTWYAEIVNALALNVPLLFDDRGVVRRSVHSALYGKSLPLGVAAVALTVIFLPDGLSIFGSGLRAICIVGSGAFQAYDAVKAAFCLVVILAGALSAYLIFIVVQLRRKLAEINARPAVR
jgi:hypothetical protein